MCRWTRYLMSRSPSYIYLSIYLSIYIHLSISIYLSIYLDCYECACGQGIWWTVVPPVLRAVPGLRHCRGGASAGGHQGKHTSLTSHVMDVARHGRHTSWTSHVMDVACHTRHPGARTSILSISPSFPFLEFFHSSNPKANSSKNPGMFSKKSNLNKKELFNF